MTTLISLIVFLVFSIVIIFFLWLSLRLVRACLGVIYKGNAFKNIGSQNLALSLGITALLFSDTVNYFIRALSRIAIISFEMFSQSVIYLMQRTEEDRGTWWFYLSNRLNPDDYYKLTDPIYNIIGNAPFASIFVMIATCLGIAVFLQGDSDNEKGRVALKWLGRITLEQRRKAIFWGALALGCYLSLAAIIAIPWIQGIYQKDPTVAKELRNRLQIDISNEHNPSIELKVDTASLITKLEKLKAEATAQTKIENQPKKLEQSLIPRYKAVRENLSNRIEVETAKLNSLSANLKDTKSDIEDQRIRLQKQVLNTFDSNDKLDLSGRELHLWADDLLRWYRNRFAIESSTLSEKSRDIKAQVEDLDLWIHKVERLLAGTSSQEIEQLAKLRNSFNRFRPYYISDEGQPADSFSPPTPRKDVGLGPLGFLGQWLIDSRSMSLALISGMIGFGLFGSVMGRAFLPAQDEDGAPIERWSGDVLLVGFSAAVIIFLASQGGLAVIAVGGSEMNPYVLFLACFVGAAFGDRVWNRAKTKLFESLKENPNPPVLGGKPSTEITLERDSVSADNDSSNDKKP